MSEESFRERYKHLTDDELLRVVEVRKDLVPEAALALDREVEKRQLKLPKAPFLTSDPTLFGIVAALTILPFLFLLLHFGQRQLVYPVLETACVILLSIWSWWDLKGELWFWATMGCFLLLHVVLILVIPWRAGWVPAQITTVASAFDLGIMYGVIGFLQKWNKEEPNGDSSAR
jgi:hypothetical protein